MDVTQRIRTRRRVARRTPPSRAAGLAAVPQRGKIGTLAVLVAVLAVPAAATAAQVSGPSSPQAPGTYTFATSDIAASYAWTCDGVPSSTTLEVLGSSTQCTFTARGRHTAGVVVNGVDPGSAIVDISVPPIVMIVGGPASAHTGTGVALAASTDGGIGSVSYTWRLNGTVIKGPLGGAAGGDTAEVTLSSAGPNKVSVTATEQFSGGATRTAEIAIDGTNTRPAAAIVLTTPGPFAVGTGGATVRLDASASNDPDGAGDLPLTYEWDFGDGTPVAAPTSPATTQHRYVRAGSYIASVTVRDRFGAASTPKTVLIQVVPYLARPISPWPIVRVRGRFAHDGALITRFTVKAPRGSAVRVRCTGRSCPYRSRRKTSSSISKLVRFNAMEKWMRAGTVIEVLVTKRGRTGKYTRLRIRSRVVPMRMDRCLIVGSFKRTLCSRLNGGLLQTRGDMAVVPPVVPD